MANAGSVVDGVRNSGGKGLATGVFAVLCKGPTGSGLNDVPPGVSQKSAEEVGKGRRPVELSGFQHKVRRSAKGRGGMGEIVFVVTEVHFES